MTRKFFLLKLASHIQRELSSPASSLRHCCPYSSLSSLPQRTVHNYFLSYPAAVEQTRCFLSSRSCTMQSTVSSKFHGFCSNPQFVRNFLSVTPLGGSSRGLLGSRVWFLKRNTSEFNPSFVSSRRGWKSWFSRLDATDVVLGLIVANVAVFMLWRIADLKFMTSNFMISLDNFRSGRLHTMITSAFSHVQMEHIISNMIGLYFFGTSIGRTFGPEFLLKLYLAGAVGGSVFYLMHHAYLASSSKGRGLLDKDPSSMPGLGASGAVNAIMLLNIFLFPKATLYFDFIIPVPAILLGFFLIGRDTLRIIEGDTQISGSAHIGGAVVAAITWARVRKGRF